MADLHIADFYKDAAVTLLQLYSYFPRKAAIYVEDVSGPDNPDEYGLHSDRFNACFSAMVWLAEEGYLRYEATIRQEAIDQAVLTHKAFTLLSSRCEEPFPGVTSESAPPSVQAETSSNIAQLRQAVKSRSSKDIREIMQYLMARSKQFSDA